MSGDAIINFSELSRVPALVASLSANVERFEKFFEKFVTARPSAAKENTDGWLDASQARQYMGGMSKGTFDKYRYETSPKIKGYKLDGKTLYKKCDLDDFIRLYELKSRGFA